MATPRQEIRVDALMQPLSHYTDLVRVGELLFVSGVGPNDPDGNVVGGDDVVEQTRQVLRNMHVMLDSAGSSFADIAKVNCYLTDISELPLVDIARREFFGESRPASTLVEVSGLAVPGMRVEIEAIAVIGSGSV